MQESKSLSLQAQAVLSERLRQAMEVARARDPRSLNILKAAVVDFTREVRDTGVPPEKVLVALKGIINKKVIPVFIPTASDWNGDRLREAVTTWCIDEYYREPSRRPESSRQEGQSQQAE